MATFEKICSQAAISEAAHRRLLRLFRRKCGDSDQGAKLGLRTVTATTGPGGELQRVQSQAWNDGSQFREEEGRAAPKIRDVEPSLVAATMAPHEFVATLAEFGVAEPDARRYFRVFDHQGTGGVDYREFVVGLVLMDKNTNHGGILGEHRSSRIFQLYDEDEDGLLSRPELENLVAQLRSLRNESVSPAAVAAATEDILLKANPAYAKARREEGQMSAAGRTADDDGAAADSDGSLSVNLSGNLEGGAPLSVGTQTQKAEEAATAVAAAVDAGDDSAAAATAGSAAVKAQAHISQKQFLKAVGDLKVRGTSQMFRLSCPILAIKAKGSSAAAVAALANDGEMVARSRSLAGAVPTDWARSKSGASVSSGAALLSRATSDSQDSEELSYSGLELAHTVISRILLDDSYTPPPPKTAFTLLDGPAWLTLINCVQNLVKNEPCCLEVPAPAKVFGDIHGQITELRALFSAYGSPNHRTGDINGFQYVFTGDFVDRGPHSLEVLALLLSLKLAYPTSVFLVRGNHEDRTLNEFYGFCDECCVRLRPAPTHRRGDGGDEGRPDNIASEPGRVVWHAANEMFEHLPLAARIGGRILALHGGVGRTLDSIEQINALNRPLVLDHGINDENDGSPSQGESRDPPDGTISPVLGSGALNKAKADPLQHLLMDILWSDPSANDDVLGVAPNTVRGGATLTYGPDRVRRFCAKNDLDLLIRAHECVGDGYQWFAGGRCVTVFSAANYCGIYENDGALLEIDRHLTVLPKVLKARPVQAAPPMTEMPESEGAYRSKPHLSLVVFREISDRVLVLAGSDDESSEPEAEQGNTEAVAAEPRGSSKRERPRGVAGPRGAGGGSENGSKKHRRGASGFRSVKR